MTSAIRAATRWCGAAAVMLAAGTALARPAEADGAAVEQALDVRALVGLAAVSADRVSDGVWEIAAEPGRRLVQVPVVLRVRGELAEAAQVDRSAFTLSGGRFVAWRVPDDSGDDAGGTAGSATRDERGAALGGGGSFRAGDSRLGGWLEGLGGLSSESPGEGRPNAGAAVVMWADAPPPGAPRLTRSLSVTPAGTLRWQMDRAVPGAVLATGNGVYLLKLDAQRLRDAEPDRPERLTRSGDEDSRTLAQRQRAQDSGYRVEQAAYRALQRSVRDLPNVFEAELPERVWAVFEVTPTRRGFALSGDGLGTWSVPWEAWDGIRELAGAGRGGQSPPAPGEGARYSDAELAALASLEGAARDPSVIGVRVAAAALSESGILGRVGSGDAVDRVARAVLARNDKPARDVLAGGLGRVLPPTTGTASLLVEAAKSGDPLAKLAALRSRLLADAGTPAGVAQAARAALEDLTNPQGPDPAGIVDALTEAAALVPQADGLLVGAISFDRVPQDRLDRAIAAVLRRASEGSSLAAQWLDARLLGSTNPQVTRRTLTLINRIRPPRGVVSAVGARLRAAVTARRAGDAEPEIDLALRNALPLTGPSHALLRLLQSPDAETAALAWSALSRFEVYAGDDAFRASNAPPQATADDAIAAVLDRARATPDVPARPLVTFLARQPDAARGTAALVQLVARSDHAALAARAGRTLLGSDRPIAETLAAAAPADRARFAERLDAALGQASGPVVGLITDEAVARFYGEQVANGTLPGPRALADAAGGEERLLQLAADPDDTLAAAAAAGLAALIGGDTNDQFALIDALKQGPDAAPRSAETVNAAWEQRKTELRVARLQDSAGDYRLIVAVRIDAPNGYTAGLDAESPDPAVNADPTSAGTVPAASTKPRRVVVGVVTLQVEPAGVRLTGDPLAIGLADDGLGVTLQQPAQLNTLNEALADLPTDALQTFTLERNDRGAWTGRAALPTGSLLEVTLEPTG